MFRIEGTLQIATMAMFKAVNHFLEKCLLVTCVFLVVAEFISLVGSSVKKRIMPKLLRSTAE